MNSSLTNLIAKKNHMPKTNYNPRLIFRRLVATALAAIAIVGNPDAPARRAYAAPADITSTAAPALGKDPPAGAAIKGNEASISGQTGALQYSYPITVPPGRNGVAPALALSYSSQAPIYGGIAAGWSLDVPMIKTDVSKGILRTQGGMADQEDLAAGRDIRDNDLFVSTMAGGRPLVPTTDAKDIDAYKVYRAKNDPSFARYERMSTNVAYRWRVRNTDGSTYYFGDSGADNCLPLDGFAHLTTHLDSFGNTIKYFYERTADIFGECYLDRIEYGQILGVPSSQNVGLVKLNYGNPYVCSANLGSSGNPGPIGSQYDLKDGNRRFVGTRSLTSIVVSTQNTAASATHVRTITLDYQFPGTTSLGTVAAAGVLPATCSGDHSPYRQLASISESASTPTSTVILPTSRFAYGSANVVRAAIMPTFTKAAGERYNPVSERWPVVKRMTLDFNGDGRTDELQIDDTDLADCRVNWRANTAGGWVTKPSFVLPRLPWTNGSNTRGPRDTCSLNYQFTNFTNSTVHACPS
jgi:hypothetical protein